MSYEILNQEINDMLDEIEYIHQVELTDPIFTMSDEEYTEFLNKMDEAYDSESNSELC